MGGLASSSYFNYNSYKNDVWLFDGSSWQLITSSAPWSARTGHGLVVFKNKIWLLGGFSPTSSYYGKNDVWNSSDGVNWILVTSSTQWQGRGGHSVSVFLNKIWLTGGFNELINDTFSDMWSSSDGINWSFSSVPWRKRANHFQYVYNNKLWIVGGNDISTSSGSCLFAGNNKLCFNGFISLNDIWHFNGFNWVQISTTISDNLPSRLKSLIGADAASPVFKNKMCIIGGSRASSSNFYNDIWHLKLPQY